jgi:hypothetical protein
MISRENGEISFNLVNIEVVVTVDHNKSGIHITCDHFAVSCDVFFLVNK